MKHRPTNERAALASPGLRVREAGELCFMPRSRFGLARTTGLFAFLGLCLYASIDPALKGIWAICAVFAVLGLLVLAMLWATQRQETRGPRDTPALLVFVGVLLVVVVALAVLSLLRS